MVNAQILQIKKQFHELVGSLSIKEIMSNQPLVRQIENLSKLLLALTN